MSSRSAKLLFVVVAVIVAGVLSGCGGAGVSGGSPLAAATVPDADFVVRIDIAGLRGSEIYRKALAESEDGAEGEAEDSELEALQSALAAAGLNDDDAVDFLMTGNVDGVSWEGDDVATQLAQVDAVMGIELAKAVSIEQLKTGLGELLKDADGKATVSDVEIAGRPGLRVESTEDDGQTALATTSQDGRVVFLAFNSASLEGALGRAGSGAFEAMPASLASVEAGFAGESQLRLALVVPDSWRQKIESQLAEAQENPEAAMFAGFVEPFKNMQSWALGARLHSGVDLRLAVDMGDEQAAQKASTLLETMVLPMVKGGLAQGTGQKPIDIDQALRLETEGARLSLTVTLTEEQIESLDSDDSDDSDDPEDTDDSGEDAGAEMPSAEG